jgi:AraC-like DNA-binding protein
MPKLTMTCDDLPVGLPDAEMLAAWRENFQRKFGQLGTDIVARCDLPGKSGVSLMPLNTVSIVTLDGKFDQIGRNQAGMPDDGSGALALAINRGPETMHFLQDGREVHVEAGQSALFGNGMVGRFVPDKWIALSIFRLPRSSLASTTRRPDELLGRPFASSSEPLRILGSYAHTMMAGDGISDPSTAQSIGRHLTDLIGLALEPVAAEAEETHLSSLRIGRIHALLSEIEAGYLDPGFSIHEVAAKQRFTPRYLHDLLAQTGIGFVERVLELRLQHALRMLSRHDQQHRKVIDIAYSSGFNDVSYFTRRFRARFAMTPGEARAAGTAVLGDVMQESPTALAGQ